MLVSVSPSESADPQYCWAGQQQPPFLSYYRAGCVLCDSRGTFTASSLAGEVMLPFATIAVSENFDIGLSCRYPAIGACSSKRNSFASCLPAGNSFDCRP